VLGALRWPVFRRLWLLSSSIQFGYWFASISFQWIVARATDNDPLMLSLLYFSVLVPSLLFSLPAGALADQLDRRRVVQVGQAGVVVTGVVTALLVVVDTGGVTAILCCAFVAGTVHALAIPASQALVGGELPPENLRSGVLLQASGMNLARVAGPAFAGVVIVVSGAVAALLVYAALAIVTVTGLHGLRLARPRPAPDGTGLVARIGSGLRHAWQRPPAGTALAVVATASLFALSYNSQLPAIAARASDNPNVFLILTTLVGVGSVAGILINALRRPAPQVSVRPAVLMLALAGVVMATLAVATHLWLVVVLALAIGALQFAIMTECAQVIQSVVADSHRGRVMSIYFLCWGGLLPIGGLVLGTTWHAFGPVVALGASGTVCVAIAVTLGIIGRGTRPRADEQE